MSGYEQHRGDVSAALQLIEELIATIGAVKEKAEEALGVTIEATGSSPVESASVARAVLASIALTKSDEMLEAVLQAQAEVTRYGGGF